MSKMIEATCVGGIVTAGGVPVPAATKLCQGVAASTGVLILDEDEAAYIAKTTPDLKSTLEKLSAAIGTIKSALQAIDGIAPLITTCGVGPGTAVWVPVNIGNVATLTAAIAEIDAFKETLK